MSPFGVIKLADGSQKSIGLRECAGHAHCAGHHGHDARGTRRLGVVLTPGGGAGVAVVLVFI
jgi:hypothetical protein